MADIKHPYICTSNFCAAGRRADPGVCVAWSVPLRLLRDRCSMHDATRNMGRVIPRACEMFCVRASCRCHAPIQMRTPHVQNRGDTISLVSCCVLLHAPSSRGAAKREEIDVPKYSSTVDCPVQDHSSLESDRSKRRRLLPAQRPSQPTARAQTQIPPTPPLLSPTTSSSAVSSRRKSTMRNMHQTSLPRQSRTQSKKIAR